MNACCEYATHERARGMALHAATRDEMALHLPGTGLVIVNLESGTLRPRTHLVGMRLCVGFSAESDRHARHAADLRAEAVAHLSERWGPMAWRWVDHDGYELRSQPTED